ncbi:MAG TPA: lytic murein transglycosylase [Solirubrobacterales bacterium]|nr:lytic murein transglycosylase [Solirubrobacterales bacterium]
MRRLRSAIAAGAVGLALAAQSAPAQAPATQPAPPAGAPPLPPASGPETSGQTGVVTGPAITAPMPPRPDKPQEPAGPKPSDQKPDEPKPGDGGTPVPKPQDQPEADVPAPPANGLDLSAIPTVPSIVCDGSTPAPAFLLPIYKAASDRYGLGPQGPSILAAINSIETNFGELNNVTSYAGAIGWMQFMPSTWAAYGVDANGDGERDPYDPEDAIFAAANYLSAAGMPQDTYNAIFAYNHADWYVADVLARAGCYGSFEGGAFALIPQLQVFTCEPAPPWRKEVPEEYIEAFEAAAGRYDLGRRGVWALAAVARLESDFGRGMGEKALHAAGPLGLDETEWSRYAVDGDDDGRIRHASVDDSAATLARMVWSRGSLRAGVFTHNQAAWYVESVLADAERLAGKCEIGTVNWPITMPEVTDTAINWDNVTLSNELERRDIQTGAVDPRVMGLIGAISQRHSIMISSLRSDHSMLTVNGNVSNHYYGRAFDIAMVDGVSCTDVSASSACSVLGRTLTLLPFGSRPSELIWCFDLDGAGPAFADPGHCDHLHVGYDG